ncbi:MAG: hypothetical protein GC160_07280 [Acidobacteria bacterium]|nr:hypothetical protein [Acidobacteriota bacterium]
MDQNQVDLLLKIMTAFTGVAAVALLLMLGMLFGMFRAMKELKDRTSVFLDRWEPMADSAQKALQELREKSGPIFDDVKALTEKGHVQMEKIDGILTDLQASSRLQLERVDQSVQKNIDRIEETVDAVQKTILQPVRQIRAVAAGIDAALKQLAGFRRRRPTVDQATLDEEMFI